MASENEPLSPEISGDLGSMIEPIYEEDIETMINEVRPEDIQHFDNKRFVRITDEQMPEILKFIDQSDQFQFDDWAIIGETKGEDEESIPGSSEDTDAAARAAKKVVTAPPGNLFNDVDGLDLNDSRASSGEADLGNEDEEEEQDEERRDAPEVENSMVFSMFLTNWEDQVRQIREAKRLEWEKKMKELLAGDDQPATNAEDAKGDNFVDEDGNSWVLIDSSAPTTCPEPVTNELQLVKANKTQIACREPFFDNWPSFNVGSKLGVVLTATGTSFAFGFMMGARAAMDSFYRLCERPLVASVVGVTTAFAVSLQPTVLMTAVKYIILGGVVGGTAVATPVFVVGTTGVFVSAAVYHSWIMAKRGVLRAISSPSSCPSPLTIPLKTVVHPAASVPAICGAPADPPCRIQQQPQPTQTVCGDGRCVSVRNDMCE